MLKQLSFIILLGFMFYQPAWSKSGGVSVGGGGNVVSCSGAGNYQSLDYVLTQNLYGPKVKLVSINTIQQSMRRIQLLLHAKVPFLAESFEEYTVQIFNRDHGKKYVWHPAALVDVPEDIPRLPYDCKNAEILQAAVRHVVTHKGASFKQVRIDYDEEIFFSLQWGNPIHLSFILVHEWLWDHVKTIEQNRRLNYLLHSTLLDELTPHDAARLVLDIQKRSGKATR